MYIAVMCISTVHKTDLDLVLQGSGELLSGRVDVFICQLYLHSIAALHLVVMRERLYSLMEVRD